MEQESNTEHDISTVVLPVPVEIEKGPSTEDATAADTKENSDNSGQAPIPGLPSKQDKQNATSTTTSTADGTHVTALSKDKPRSKRPRTTSVHPPCSLPSSPSRGTASSEEESVAEMDYMSEGSNLSVKGLLHPSSNADFKQHHTAPGFGHFFPRRLPVPCNPSSTLRKSLLASNQKSLPKVNDFDHNNYSDNPRGNESIVFDSPMALTAGNVAGVPRPNNPSSTAAAAAAAAAAEDYNNEPMSTLSADGDEHRPLSLPQFRAPQTCYWTASHAANCPSEDRSASLVNILLQPLPPNFDSETQLLPLEPDYKTLIRLNLWSVIDGHGGGCVATYASEVLLPHIAASVSRALGCAIVDRGVCTVNGQLRDANALDLDGLIQSSDRAPVGSTKSIHYRSPYERSDSEEDADAAAHVERDQVAGLVGASGSASMDGNSIDGNSLVGGQLLADNSIADTLYTKRPQSEAEATVSSAKTSVKTAASPANREALLGTQSPQEVAAITRAITESFLAVDEAWINSIDPVATHQNSCQSNGRWNSGACALVVFTVQRLDWTSVSEPDREKESRGPENNRKNTSQNRAAARRRMLDYASRTKSASSMSTVSSTSSLTTEEAAHTSGLESEITETEGEDDDRSQDENIRKRAPLCDFARVDCMKKESLISAPGGCSCHCYRAHDAVMYTAHVGDCRAVMLGSAPPRTIKVRDTFHLDTTDDESSHHSSDETECLSSSDHDADSSEYDDVDDRDPTSAATASYVNFPRRVARQRSSRRRMNDDAAGPYIALPPLDKNEPLRNIERDLETEWDRRERFRHAQKDTASDSSTSSHDSSYDQLPLVHLPPVVRPIDLTTDHSAYNPAEVAAVLRRCNNAPRAISAGVGGGIKRVAGSLAVTRALGDAYLKTPTLSFLPYKSHAPYISARPEVNCRPLIKTGDKVLVLATDGVWERASGEDVLRWVRNFYEERIAEAERRSNRRVSQPDSKLSSEDSEVGRWLTQEGTERDLFDNKNGVDQSSRKREITRSPSPPAKRRKRSRKTRISYNVADVIVRRVLNKVRRARNISSLQALMALPQGRARRSKHDDITACVVDLSAFVS